MATKTLGTIWTAQATLYSKGGKRLARCADTPNAIARVFVALPAAVWVRHDMRLGGAGNRRARYADRIESMRQHPDKWLTLQACHVVACD